MTGTFSISINNEQSNDENFWKEFQSAMDEYYESLQEETKQISESLGVSMGCASDIQYLRTRSRWSQELENNLIDMDKKGLPLPNICDYGVTEETQRNMTNLIETDN